MFNRAIEKGGLNGSSTSFLASQYFLEQSKGIEWKECGKIERGFDMRNGKLIVKEKGPFKEDAEGSKPCKMKDSPRANSSWYGKYKEEIRSVVVCHGVSSIGDYAFIEYGNGSFTGFSLGDSGHIKLQQ